MAIYILSVFKCTNILFDHECTVNSLKVSLKGNPAEFCHLEIIYSQPSWRNAALESLPTYLAAAAQNVHKCFHYGENTGFASMNEGMCSVENFLGTPDFVALAHCSLLTTNILNNPAMKF